MQKLSEVINLMSFWVETARATFSPAISGCKGGYDPPWIITNHSANQREPNAR